MFPDRYFANRYFAPRYFMSIGAAVVVAEIPDIVFRLPRRNMNATATTRIMNFTAKRRK
jgi:hypothetical protein